MKKHHEQSAFTLIEVIVALGIVGLLALILIPAVQTARETSRRIACQNNLKQIGLAAQSYATSHGCFPFAGGFHSATQHLALLSYMEQAELFSAWNFGRFGRGGDSRNNTVEQVRVKVFICPSDEVAGEFSKISYPANHHFDVQKRQNAGIFVENKVVHTAMVTDGLSHTAIFSEFVIGGIPPWRTRVKGYMRHNADIRHPTFWITFAKNEKQDMDAAIARCRNVTMQDAINDNDLKGHYYWTLSTRPRSGYDHHTTPNQPTCQFDPSDQRDTVIVPASSHHTGGMHAVFCDGHVSFVRNAIDAELWRAAGTRNGGESIANDSF